MVLSNSGDRFFAGGRGVLIVYSRTNVGWSLKRDLSSYFTDRFRSIAISLEEGTFVSGDYLRNDETGALLVFNNNDSGWDPKGQVLTVKGTDELLGRVVAINGDGTIIAVGAPDGDYVEIFQS